MPSERSGLASSALKIQQEWRFVAATFAASGVGYLGSAGAPILTQALVEASLGTQRAGDLGTFELTMLALTSTFVTPFVTRVSHRKLALFGTSIAVVGLLISILSESYASMIIGRILTGSGSGLAISGANAAVAAREDAERIFAIIWTMGGAITAALPFALPPAVVGDDYAMVFGVLLVLCLLGLPLMFWLPPEPELPELDPMNAGGAQPRAGAVGPSNEAGDALFTPTAVMALAGMFIYSVAEQALWSFGYYIPVEAGVPEELVGEIISGTVLMGLAGGAFAAWLGTRGGRVMPIVAGSLVSLAGRWIFISSTSTEFVFIGGLLWGLGFYFVSPYQIGLVAALDRRGRLAVAAGGAMNFGYAMGPMIGGRLLERFDASIFLIGIVGATIASLLLLLPLAFRVERLVRDEELEQVGPH